MKRATASVAPKPTAPIDPVHELLDRARLSRTVEQLLAVARRAEKIGQAALVAAGLLEKRVLVLNGYTGDVLTGLTRALLLEDRVALAVHQTGYGLYEEAIYGDPEPLVRFAPDLCYVNVGTDHLGFRSVDEEIARWAALWKTAHERLGCDIIQNTFEEPAYRVGGSFDARWPSSRLRFVRKLNDALVETAPRYVHFNDVNFLSAYHGRKHFRDEKLYDLAKLPVAYRHQIDAANSLRAVIAAIFGRTRKCLVLDLDNTLWGGVIADDGVAGIQIAQDSGAGEAYLRFQAYVKALKDRGIILAVCSKNDPRNARLPFEQREEMVLGLDDISCFVANFEPKPNNLITIARTLNLGLDALVFVDDDPRERAIVRETLGEVAVPEMPEDPALYVQELARQTYFETVAITEEDAHRTQEYRANAARTELEVTAGSYAGFLERLGMHAAIAPFDDAHVPRVTQLINKSNQFNLTTKRYSESQVTELLRDRSVVTRFVRLTDKFGDLGLISVFIGRVVLPDTLAIDTWLMSCRVLKRRVENVLFQEIVREALARGLKAIEGEYLPTPKNKLVEGLLADLGFSSAGPAGNAGARWRFSLEDTASVRAVLDAKWPIALDAASARREKA